ncbi:hypothetical protein JCM11641_006689 [Rhodosporidiobolus odoratus]
MPASVKLGSQSLASSFLPTLSPSPPSLLRDLPTIDPSSPHSIPFSTIEVADARLKARHDAHARRLADQVRLVHLAKAFYSSPSPNLALATSATGLSLSQTRSASSLRMTRYKLEVERFEGEEKVLKRVTVIIPDALGKKRNRAAPYDIPSKLPLTTSLTLIPPTASSSSPRRPFLPSLRALSLLPPPAPPRLFQSASPASSRPSPGPTSYIQRRRPALTLRHSTRGCLSGLGKNRVRRERDRLDSLVEEEDLEAEVERLSLGERRGKVVTPLVLV